MTGLRPRRIFLPLSWVYGGAVVVRNMGYDAGMLRVHRAAAPVVAVGNLTAGGTGKTPLVAEIVRRLQASGRKVGVISRGYGRRSRGPVVVSGGGHRLADPAIGGDEPVMLARAFPEAVVVVAERRHLAAEIAVQQLGADVLVVDDGFQHRALARDLNILVVDGRSALADEPLLPAGLRREPLAALRRADALAISKVETSGAVADVVLGLSLAGTLPVFGYRTAYSRMTDLATGEERNVKRGTSAYALSGIGDPRGFLETLRAVGMDVRGARDAADHHVYTVKDVDETIQAAQRLGCAVIATTDKDAVRLNTGEVRARVHASGVPFVVVHVTADVFFGGETLDGLLQAALAGRGGAC